MKQETTAQLRYLRMGPRKIRLLLDLIRGMKVGDALRQLQFSSKTASAPLVKLVHSAIANAAHNYQMPEESLIVKRAFVDGGPMQYRWMPRAHGRASPIRKRTAHVTIVLEGDMPEGKGKKKETTVIDATPVVEEKKPKTTKKTVAKKKETKK